MARQRAGDVTIYKNTGFGSQDYAQEIRPVLPQRWAFLEQARHFVHCVKNGQNAALWMVLRSWRFPSNISESLCRLARVGLLALVFCGWYSCVVTKCVL